MTWFGWFLVAEFAFSAVFHIAKNGDRKPRTSGELAVCVVEHVLMLLGVLLIGTGSL